MVHTLLQTTGVLVWRIDVWKFVFPILLITLTVHFVIKVTEFLQQNNLPPKALLIVDNASAHKIEISDDNFRIIFLPPNATALIQPLDQNVLRSTKLRYRNRLISHIISTGSDIISALKQIDLKIVFEFLAAAWYSLSEELVATAWKVLLSPDEDTTVNVESMDEDSDSDEEMSLTVAELRDRQNREASQRPVEHDSLANERDQILLEDVNVTQLLLNELDPDSQEYSTEEIIDWNDDIGDLDDYDEDDNSDDETIDTHENDNNNNAKEIFRISHQQGFEALNLSYRYLLQDNIEQNILAVIRVAKDDALQKSLSQKKQKSITNYFNATI